MTNENNGLDLNASVGRVLHFVIENRHGIRCRPAVVVEDWPESGKPGYVNLQVFTDGSNDGHYGLDDHEHGMSIGPRTEKANETLSTRWETSVLPNHAVKAVRSWHWPRLCSGLEQPPEPYVDGSNTRYHHNHKAEMADEHNCLACSAIKRDEKTASIRK